MSKLFKFLMGGGIFLTLLLSSCSSDDGSKKTPPPEEVEVTIDDLDPENLPTESTWVVTNDEVTSSDDLTNLIEALDAAAEEGREVEIVLATIESLPENSFSDCESITTISLPAVTTISESAFSGCTSLTTIEVPAAEVVADNAFSGCVALEEIALPAVTTISEAAFSGCVALTTIEVPVAEVVADNAFSGCAALEDIALPATTDIGSGAFASCDKLTSLALATDTKLQSIATDAFASTTLRSSTSSITIQITLTVGSDNFEYINGNTITIGDFTAEFGEIIILGVSDVDINSPSITDWENIPLTN